MVEVFNIGRISPRPQLTDSVGRADAEQTHPTGTDSSTTPWVFYATDSARSVMTLAGLAAAQPWLRRAPKGDGHPVIVVPSFGAGDLSTAQLRRFLRRLGYEVSGWGLGVNPGPTPRVMTGLERQIDELANRHGQPVSIVGWSLGGVLARWVARQRVDSVRQVITLGSPYNLRHPSQTRVTRFYMRFARWHVAADELPDHEWLRGPLPVPATSIYSKLDGVANWRACAEESIGDRRENIAVLSSHMGFGHDPAVLWAIADRLAQPAGHWQPFKAPSFARALYPPAQIP